jgi:thiazole/oxazole-forming peptide maturase SagD family component
MAAASMAPAPAADSAPGAVTEGAGPALIREARRILRRGPQASPLVDHVLIIDTSRRVTSRHRVIPLSRCPACGGAGAFPRSGDNGVRGRGRPPAGSSRSLLAALAGWIDPRTGVISGLVLERPADTGVALPRVVTTAPPRVVDEGGSLQRLPLGWGKGVTWTGAILSAVGEAVERYAAWLPDPARLRWARRDELDGECLDPGSVALYSDEQYRREGFPYRRFDPAGPHPWVSGTWLGTDRRVWVPAVLAFLSLTLHPEQLLCQGSSNGLAAATDPHEAALRATLELVERDALMAAWLTGQPGTPVELDRRSRLRRIIDGVEALGCRVELYVLPTSACGTTAMCLALGDGRRYPGATIALGADLDPGRALRQAILELGQTGPFLRRMMRTRAIPVPRTPSRVRTMLDHAAYYFPRDRAAAFDRLRSRAPAVSARELARRAPARTLASCAAALAASGVRVALVDVTSPDVATGPFRVARAVSPDLQPISHGHGLDRAPVPRLRARGLVSGKGAPIHPVW